jgi:uncharacterized membrane protein
MNRRAKLALALRVLFGFVAVAPFLPHILAGTPGLGAALDVIERWFRFQCERDPLRSFAGVAVCARCLGIYVGFGLGGAIGRPRLPVRAVQVWILAALLLLLGDVLSEALEVRPAWAALRVATGSLLAYPIGLVVRASLTSPA